MIMLQESWLSDIICNTISESLRESEVSHSSAMELKLSSGFKRGRPFDGTAVVIRRSFVSDWYRIATNNPSLCAVCCKLRNGESVVFGCVYMPYDDGSRDRAIEYEAVIGSICKVLLTGVSQIFGVHRSVA